MRLRRKIWYVLCYMAALAACTPDRPKDLRVTMPEVLPEPAPAAPMGTPGLPLRQDDKESRE
jgi:hypothetical protein